MVVVVVVVVVMVMVVVVVVRSGGGGVIVMVNGSPSFPLLSALSLLPLHFSLFHPALRPANPKYEPTITQLNKTKQQRARMKPPARILNGLHRLSTTQTVFGVGVVAASAAYGYQKMHVRSPVLSLLLRSASRKWLTCRCA